MKKQSFTLVELMIVIAVLAILAAIILFVLNPINVLNKARDSKRISDINSIYKSISFLEANEYISNYGSSTTVYISLLDTTSSTCSSYSLPALLSGYTYNCVTDSTKLQLPDSTGWLPINFNQYLKTLNVLPVDPINNETYFYSYFPGGSYELTATLSENNVASMQDGGIYSLVYERGSINRSFSTPIQRGTSAEVLLDGLIYYFKFDEDSTTSTTDSINGEIATLSNITRVPGKDGEENTAVKFSGTASSIVTNALNDLPSGNSARTIEFWLYLNDAPFYSYSNIVGYGENSTKKLFNATITNERKNMLWGSSANHTGTDTIGLLQWHHIVYTYDGTEIKSYINGEIEGSTTVDLNTNTSGDFSKIYFGYNSHLTTVSQHFNDTIDNFRIYNRALSASEIQNIYTVEKGPDQTVETTEAEPVFHINFDNNITDQKNNTSCSWYSSSNNYESSDNITYGNFPNNNYITCDTFPEIEDADNITFLLWLYPTSILNDGYITQSSKTLLWGYYGSFSTVVYNSNNYATSSDRDTNNWYLLVSTFSESGETKLFINAELAGSSIQHIPETSSENLIIGKYGSGYFASGFMDEIRIYDTVLSLPQIENIFNNEKSDYGL
jgi:prepilin-type N-terminal cleavage/methylation domain-containing protein